MKTGYVAEYKNSADLANGVELLLGDGILREKAGIWARKRVEDNFTLDKMIEAYIDLYYSMIKKV